MGKMSAQYWVRRIYSSRTRRGQFESVDRGYLIQQQERLAVMQQPFDFVTTEPERLKGGRFKQETLTSGANEGTDVFRIHGVVLPSVP